MRKTLPLVLALAIAGCSFTPDYQRPAAPVPAAWPQGVGAGDTAQGAAITADWRAFFTDPRLQALIAAALEHNRDLRISLARVDEARALAGIARADRLPTVDVANAWLSLLELGERLELARATLKSREETRTLVGRRRDVGLAGDLDYLQADGALQNARAEVASLARAYAAAENALRLLVGAPSAETAGGSLAQPGLVAEVAVALPADILLQRPDVMAAEQKLIAANANIGAARAAFLPRIVLTAALGTASHGLSGLFEAGSGAWSFVPALRQPLFDSGRTAENVDLASARKLVAVAEYEKTIQQAFREIADLLEARRQLADQLQAQEAGVAAQSRRLTLVDARYKAGVSSHLELLDAQREQFAAQQSALAVRRQLLSTTASFYKALGGGAAAR